MAQALGQVSESQQGVLEALCISAETELTGRLRDGVTPEDCGPAFVLGCAWLALAGLAGGQYGGGGSFTAGSVTIREAGSGEKNRKSIDWSVKPTRIIQRSESGPVTYLGGGFSWGWGHHRHWHGPYAGFGPQVAFATRVYNQQLYMRELDVKLLEMKGSRATTVFTAIVKNEATCNRIDDILPYMVKSAIDNLYAQDGTVKVVELPEVSEVCR